MFKRTVTGIIMAGFLFLILWLTAYSHFIFDAVVLAVCAVCAAEMYGAVKRATSAKDGAGYNVSRLSLIFLCLIIYPLSYFFGYTGLLFAAVLSVIFAFIVFIFNSKKTLNDFAVNTVVIFYPILLLALLFVINKNYGMIPVVLAIGISTISDAFACWFGAAIGKRKIFPKISPKKTWAGSIAGLFGGAVGGIAVYLIFELGAFPTHVIFKFSSLVGGSTALTVLIYAAVGFAVAVFSEIGDLAASRVKREAGIKDYGKILGSHGGIMDRVDSIAFTSVCIAVIMQIISLAV